MDSFETAALSIDQQNILRYAELSNDFNPIHVDPVFAATTPMAGVIAHGTLSLNLLLDALERSFGLPRAGIHIVEVRFRQPVRIGDSIIAGGDRQPDNSFAVWVRNQRGEAVIEGLARIDEPATL